MKPVGNIAGLVDFSKPLTREVIQKALKRAKAEQQGLTLQKALDAGYEVQAHRPTLIAQVCAAMFGHQYKPIPHLVKSH